MKKNIFEKKKVNLSHNRILNVEKKNNTVEIYIFYLNS